MEDRMTVGEAAEYLGVSRTKVWALIKEGALPVSQNPLDKRQRLVPVEVLAELRARGNGNGRRRPWPRTVGIVASGGDVQSEDLEDYMRERWRPDWY